MKGPRAAVLLAAALLLGCSCSTERRELKRLDLEAEAAQVLLIGVEGSIEPSAATVELLKKLPVGGVLLFSYNLRNTALGLGRFTAELQDAAAASTGLPLIVSIDHEGGSVFRFKGEDITKVPAPAEVGARPAAEAARYAEALGRAAGSELSALGVNMALAPVVELLGDQNAAFLGSRSYGRDPGVVDAAADAYIRGLQAEGVAAVAKHFPGNAAADPHLTLPRLDFDRATFERDSLPRFVQARRAGVAAVMLSHVLCPSLDPKEPASLSAPVVGGLLRGRAGFRGLALTDDLCMRALTLSRSPETSAVEALAAGADLLMVADMDRAPRVRGAIVQAVESGALPRSRLDEAALRILAVKRRFAMETALDPDSREKRLASYPGLVAENARRLSAFHR